MDIETVADLADKIADWLGIFGGCKNVNDCDDDCTYNKDRPFCCRQGFVGAMEERMVQAVENDKKLKDSGLKQ